LYFYTYIVQMLVPVRCITCGTPIGHIAPAFAHARRKRARTALGARGTLPMQAMVDAELALPVGDILDRLAVTHDCCRKTLVTTMIFQDYY
jgi:DNA-directed RNA polymerase subunit N (RpoN/RPB10)